MYIHQNIYHNSQSIDNVKINELITCLVNVLVRDGRALTGRNKMSTLVVGLGMEVVDRSLLLFILSLFVLCYFSSWARMTSIKTRHIFRKGKITN